MMLTPRAATAVALWCVARISTCVMIKQGKVYGNQMVDMQASNSKLSHRKIHIVSAACGISMEEAAELLEQCDGNMKVAIVVHMRDVTPEEAAALLKKYGGYVKKAIHGE